MALDKIAKKEQWGREPERRDNLAAFAAKLAESGGKLTVVRPDNEGPRQKRGEALNLSPSVYSRIPRNTNSPAANW